MATYQATAKAADAPDIEGAMYDLVFVGSEAKRITGGKFVKDTTNGDPKLELSFNLVSNDEDVPGLILGADGEPVVVNKLVGVGFNTQSKTVPAEVLFLKAICTKAEFEAFLNGEGTPDDEEAAPLGLLNRVIQGEVFIKENGWPGIGALVAPKGAQKGKPYRA